VFEEVANFGYEFRQYDSRLGRWWSIDPEVSKFPGESPFLFCGGNPILYLDKYGRYKLPQNEARKSAMFAKYLNSCMKKDVLNSSNIMRGLRLYGQLSDAEIEELLTPGKGPEIYIVDGSAIQNANANEDGNPICKSSVGDEGHVFESDVYFYEGVYNMEEYWTKTIENMQDAIEVVKEKSKTEEGRKDLPTVPKP